MDKLIRSSVNNLELTFFTVIIIMIMGIQSYLTLPQNEDPSITVRVVQIITYWQGATPEDVELYVSKPIENAVSKQDEVDKITSCSLPGVSIITVEISSYADISKVTPAFQQIRNYINDIRGDLPDDIAGPEINDRFGETSAFVLGLVSKNGNHTYRELESIGDRIKDNVKTVEGVGDFDYYGVQPEKIYIQGSTAYFSSIGVTPDKVINAIKSRNAQIPQAYLNLADKRIQIQITGPYVSLDQIENTVVFTDPYGRVMKLKDMEGEVVAGYKDPPVSFTRTNNQKSIVMAFSMKRGNHIVKWGKKIDKVLDDVKSDLPEDIELVTLSHQPRGVEKSVQGFMSNFYQAVLLVIVVIGIGMGLRNAMIVAIAIPLIMLSTFAVMGVWKIELQQMSINALIIALGMVVDNAIVIVDNVTRYIKMGYSKVQAAFQGAREVKIALFSGTLTTIAAFGPLALMPGDVGAYIVDLPRVISVALIVSYLVAMFFTPAASRLLLPSKEEMDERDKKKAEKNSAAKEKGEKRVSGLTAVYYSLIDFILKFRYLVVLVLLVMLGTSFYITLKYIPISFFPPGDKSQFVMNVWLPEGWDLTGTSKISNQLEHKLEEMKSLKIKQKRSPLLFWDPPVDEPVVTSYVSYVGIGGPRFYIGITPEAPQYRYAQIMVNTSSSYHTNEAIKILEEYVVKEISGARVDILRLDTGPPVAAPIQVQIAGMEINGLKEVGKKVEEILAKNSSVTGFNNNFGYDSYRLVLKIDQDKANMLGLNSEDIAVGIYVAFEGYPITRLKAPERQIDVLLRLTDKERRDVEDLKAIRFISHTTGKSHRLDEFSTIDLETQTSAIVRKNERRTLTVNAYVSGMLPSQVLAEIKPLIEKIPLEKGYEITYAGQEEASSKAFGDLAVLAVMALMILLLILAFQFKSIKIALAIYLSIPLAFIGAVAGMYLMKQPLGFMSALGLISLAGVVVNNAILMIEFITDNMREGKELHMSIKEAGVVRFRPIMLTTISTLGGLLPLALFGGVLFAPMCWVIIFGLSFSTMLTLFVVPLFFMMLGGVKDAERIIESERTPIEPIK